MLLSIDHKVLLTVERGLSQLWRFLCGLVFEVFSVCTTAMAYLRHQVGTLSSSFISFCMKEPCFWQRLLTRSDRRFP